MNKLFLYVLVGVLLVASVFAVEKNEFVQLVENTDHCFDCWTIYKIVKADDAPLTKLGLDFRDVKGEFVLPDYDIGYLTSENYSELVDVYEPCAEPKTIINNETGLEESVEVESSCYAGQKEVEKTREYYVFSGGDPTATLKHVKDWYDAAVVGDALYIKVTGQPERGTALDNILVLNDYVYDEYAWWNTAFYYRMLINCSQINAGTPIIINGSSGFSIGGYQQIVWTRCENNTGLGTGLAVYYNNYSDYVVANDTAQKPFEVEVGNRSSYNASSVWVNFSFVFHLNDSIVNVANSANNGTNNGVTFRSGFIGRGGNFTGSSWINLGTISRSANQPFTAQAWFMPQRATSASSDDSIFGHSSGDYSCGGPMSNMDNQIGCFTNKYISGGSVTAGVWYLLTFTFDGSTLYISWNNTLGNSSASSSTGLNGSYALGRFYGGSSSNYAQGAFDEVRISDSFFGTGYASQTYNNYLGLAGYGSVSGSEANVAANESAGRDAIIAGVDVSEIASTYTAYNDKQVYERLANGSQYKGTFDVFVVSGNKRWAFNYDQNTSSGFPVFFNITPVFYVWQNYNLSQYNIWTNVQSFIDSTN